MEPKQSPLKNARIALAESHLQLQELDRIYAASLRQKETPDRVLALVKGALENYRSVLDYIAYELLVEFGTLTKDSEKAVQYPLFGHPNEFDKMRERKLPGVDSYPPAVELVKRHQPYQLDHEWMGWLSTYVNPNKHRRYTPQTRVESLRVNVMDENGGGVSWNPGAVQFSGGGITMNGIPVDPRTQRPVRGYEEITYVDWLFEGSDLSVRSVLRTIGGGLRNLVSDCELELGW